MLVKNYKEPSLPIGETCHVEEASTSHEATTSSSPLFELAQMMFYLSSS